MDEAQQSNIETLPQGKWCLSNIKLRDDHTYVDEAGQAWKTTLDYPVVETQGRRAISIYPVGVGILANSEYGKARIPVFDSEAALPNPPTVHLVAPLALDFTLQTVAPSVGVFRARDYTLVQLKEQVRRDGSVVWLGGEYTTGYLHSNWAWHLSGRACQGRDTRDLIARVSPTVHHSVVAHQEVLRDARYTMGQLFKEMLASREFEGLGFGSFSAYVKSLGLSKNAACAMINEYEAAYAPY